ncbi:MAG: hypothetical protein AB7V50_05265 [Vampirovibrionia bacterium]
MTAQGSSSFENLLNHLHNLPLWIKQVVYAELKGDLESSAARLTLEYINRDDTLQLYIPQITFLGKKELDTKTRGLSATTYKFLEGADDQLRVLDICIRNSWNLETCALQLLATMDQELVSPPRSAIISGTAQYLGGRIRLGEYLIKLNKISIDQLDQALRTQKYIEQSIGERTGLAEVLINLGYITQKDTESILFLKEESKKRYIPEAGCDEDSLNVATSGKYNEIVKENAEMKEQLDRAMNENAQLREQLRKLLKIK